jgi:26S proteasome regulatory subunit N8
LLRDISHSTTQTLSTRVTEQLASLRGLRSRLQDLQGYLAQVAAGELPVHHPVVYALQDALNLLPDLADSATTRSFAASTNDQLLVVYLSSLVRAVIALHALVDNKATIGRAELEEERGDDEKKGDEKKGEHVKDEKEKGNSEKGL